MEQVKKKYGLWTGMAMVVGVVLGCGIFIKAGDVLRMCGGNLALSLLAWTIGGIIMVSSGFCFAIYATKVEKFNGLVDYVEFASNKRVGYQVGYFFATMYFPIVGSHVSIVAASYLMKSFNAFTSVTSWNVMLTAFIILTLIVLLNYLSPKIAARTQIGITFIKLVPVLFIVVIGLINITKIGSIFTPTTIEGTANSFGEAIKITSFAYDGWICAAALNAEMKDSKKNLPKAFVGGTIAILILYLVYFISLSLILGNATVVEKGAIAPIEVFNRIFGSVGGTFFLVLIFCSCIGNVNAMSMCTVRSVVAIAVRGHGIKPEILSKTYNDRFSIFTGIFNYAIMCFYLLIWWLAFSEISFFKYLNGMDEIVCSILYGIYIVVYIYMIKNYKELNFMKRFVMPIIAILGSVFFVLCGSGLYQLIFERNITPFYSFLVFLGLGFVISIPSLFLFRKTNLKTNKIK